MRKPNPFSILSLIIALGLLFPTPAFADGIIIPDPPNCDPGACPDTVPMNQLAIVYHHVDVRIEGQLAITHVDQVFRNDQAWEIEGTYVFPIPVDAVVDRFTLWMDGVPVEGRVLTREEARRTYENIVRQMRDPALLEYIDRGAVQASIYPIPSGGERRIELEYAQVLPLDRGLIHYVYPLNTEKFSSLPLEDVRVTIEVASNDPVRAVYSPSHNIDILRDGEYNFTVSYEASAITPDTDFELYYSLSTSDIGVNVVSYRDPQAPDEDGYFLLLAAPSVAADPERTVARDVFLVLDQSGSMDGEKFQQAQDALEYILLHLNPEDRFNIISFSTGTRMYAEQLQPAAQAEDGIRWVRALSAHGSTDINRALLETFVQTDQERTSLVIFLTDGLPTEGVTERESILTNLNAAAPPNLRLFAFGVGFDVDTHLLDAMSQDHHGQSAYVRPGEALDEAVSTFYTTISTPVMTDIALDFGDVRTYDMYPAPLPDLFAGQQIVLMGRYRNSGTSDIQLTGYVEDEKRLVTFTDLEFVEAGGSDLIPRLWATRKIGFLLNEIRLSGPEEELVQQVVALSIRFGIVTPYTSYLVTEENVLSGEAQEEIAAEAYADMLAMPTAVSGASAVERAEAEAGLSSADAAIQLDEGTAEVVQQVGARTFTLQGEIWIDTGYNPDTMDTIQVPFLSNAYFDLLAQYPDMGAALALGERVIVCGHSLAYEIVASDQESDPLTFSALPQDETENMPASVQTALPSGSAGCFPAPLFVLGCLLTLTGKRLLHF